MLQKLRQPLIFKIRSLNGDTLLLLEILDQKGKITTRSFQRKPKVIFFGVLLYIKFALAAYFIYTFLAQNGTEKFLAKSEKEILYKKGKQEKALMTIHEDLYFLSHLNSVQNLSTMQSGAETDLLEFMKTRPAYDHLRILDTSGHEIIRVNNVSTTTLVEKEKLQDKSQRDYFINSKGLASNEYYVSPISLNSENGKIEQPLKPVFRLVTPVYNDSVKLGYLCVNYKLKHLLTNFQQSSKSNAHFDLVDGNGVLLSQLIKEKSPEILRTNSQKLKPQKHQGIGAIRTVESNDYVFMTTPLEWNTSSIPLDQLKPHSATSSNADLTLIYYIPEKVLAAVNNNLFYSILISFIAFSLFYFATVWFLHIQRMRKHELDVRFQSIFNKTATFIGLLHPDGTLLEANDTALNFGGFTIEQARGLKLWDAPWWSLNDNIKTQLINAIDEARNGNEVRYDVDVVGGSGEVITIDFTLRPVFDENGKVIYIIPEGKDITERQRLQAEINDRNIQNNAIQKISKTGFWKVDLRTRTPHWDEMVYEIHEEPLGKKVNLDEAINYYREDYRPIIQTIIANAIEANKSWEEEAVIVTGKGREKWVHTIGYPVYRNGELVELRGTFSDIDLRKRNEQIIAENEERLRLALETAGLGLWEWNVTDNSLEWDISIFKMFFINQDEFQNDMSCWERIIHKKDRETFKNDLQKSLSTQKGLKTEFRIITPNNKVRIIRCLGTVLRDEDDKPNRMLGVCQDITESTENRRKILELNSTLEEKVEQRTAEITAINRRLDSANKELEAFSYSVSHDLKAPLRALQGFSKNLVEKYSDSIDETGIRWLQFIQDNASRMDTLIADILSFSRINRAKPKSQKYSMREVIEQKLDTIERIYTTPATVTIAEDLPNIRSDRTMLEVVWQNLIDNAFKYSQKKEHVEINISAQEEEKGITYSISDNGAGFDMKYYDKIFGVFQRLHSNEEFEGTGVGLANVSRILTKHNGCIKATSELGKGTTFQFFIPKN